MTKKKEGRRICKCECGGTVRGVEEFGRLWTWCETCTPVVSFPVRDYAIAPAHRGDGAQ